MWKHSRLISQVSSWQPTTMYTTAMVLSSEW